MLTALCSDVPFDEAGVRRWPAPLLARLRRAALRARYIDEAPIPALSPLEHWLGGQFGLQPSGAVTIAAFERFAYQQSPEPLPDNKTASGAPGDARQVLTVTPVYLHAGLDHLILHPGHDLAITQTQASALIEAANAFLDSDDIRLSALAPACWLLSLPGRLELAIRSSMQAAGRNIHAYMPAGRDGRRLRAILNELQMLWHDHPVNEQRQREGLPPVNSIWVEGEVAPDPARPDGRLDVVMTDQPVTRGLAGSIAGSNCASGPLKTMPVDLTRLAGLRQAQRNMLIELSGTERLSQLGELVEHWPDRMTICLTDTRQWLELISSPTDKWRFWRPDALASATAGVEPRTASATDRP